MDNKCFVIMPQGEPDGYSQGHFNRVYDYVIAPACRAAGYWPTRAENAGYDNPLDILKDIIDSDVALLDVSGNNSIALYAVAIRQALGLPVTLVKDSKSIVMFDASDPDVIEYDDSLRIDTVQKAIESVGDALKLAIENKKGKHELLNRVSIAVPKFAPQDTMIDSNLTFSSPTSTDDTNDQEKETQPKEERLPIISPLPDYVGEPFTDQQIVKLKPGDVLFHLIHGDGKVNFVKKMGKEELASIQFESGPKLLVLVSSDFFRKVKK